MRIQRVQHHNTVSITYVAHNTYTLDEKHSNQKCHRFDLALLFDVSGMHSWHTITQQSISIDIFSMKSNTINHIWCHQCIDEMLDFLPQNFLFGTIFCVTKYLNTKHILGLKPQWNTFGVMKTGLWWWTV